MLWQFLPYSKATQLYTYVCVVVAQLCPTDTLEPCCLSIPSVIACIYQPHTPSPSLPPHCLGDHKSVPSVSLFLFHAAAAANSLQSCPLCDPIDGSPPGSPVPGILQAKTLEWVAISFSNAWKWKVKVKLLSRVQLLATPWTAAYQAPPSMGFSRQEYWSGVPLPSPLFHR